MSGGTTRARSCAVVLALLVAGGGLACHRSGGRVVQVRAQLAPAAAVALAGRVYGVRATARAADQSVSRDLAEPDSLPLRFPASLSLRLPEASGEPTSLEVLGLDVRQNAIARAFEADLRDTANGVVEVLLTCLGTCPSGPGQLPDGGVPPELDGGASAACGNARLEAGETCDVAIAAGAIGACPASCDDGIACTTDALVGSACSTRCVHKPVADVGPADGCCPSGALREADPDCSRACGDGVVQPAETCDTALAGLPGGCPTGTTACDDGDPCSEDLLLSERTCQARCVHYSREGLLPGDGCCPALGDNTSDPDCPAVCGNGAVEAGETCDTGVPPGSPGACPTACAERRGCAGERLMGSGCRAVCLPFQVTTRQSGDGCCPVGSTRLNDLDCPAVCGNGSLERGERCDPGLSAGSYGTCPANCAAAPEGSCAVANRLGEPASCDARCVLEPVSVCSRASDGCCPAGCTAATDVDCSATCGNGVRDAGERCDTAAPAGDPAACPTSCDDGDPCTFDLLVGRGGCGAACTHGPVTTPVDGDGCCPAGATTFSDGDCPSSCGDGLVDPIAETCDTARAPEQPGACPVDCPTAAPPACTTATWVSGGSACTVRCEPRDVTACVSDDGCCPPGCDAHQDADCAPVCGNGVLEPGERCDRALAIGAPGACPTRCQDASACTRDITIGSAARCDEACLFVPITACADNDGCCPTGCAGSNDNDCVAVCGDGRVGQGEWCDPPASCPTRCPTGSDACTRQRLVGDPAACTARCEPAPAVGCSSAIDGCCPSGCSADPDCPSAPP